MLISGPKKVIYFHPPKCGGMTIRRRLLLTDGFRRMGVSSRSLSINYSKPKIFHYTHTTLDMFLNASFYNKNDYMDYRLFTFVRNPYNRFYSFYQFFFRTIKRVLDLPQDAAPTAQVFNRYEEWYFSPKFKVVLDRKGPSELTPQHYYTHYEGQNYMDFIGRVESFEEDFELIKNRYDLNTKKQSVRHRRGSGSSYLEHYDVNTIKFVNDEFTKDFEYFNYKKEEV